MKSIIHFIKYHNAFTIIFGLVLLITGGAFASEDVRNTVIGEKVETVQGVDNSRLLAADLDGFDLAAQITGVKEDGQNYYVDYIYKTLAIQGNVWQEALRSKSLTVAKSSLRGKDLGLYIQEEVGENIDYELRYLREVQQIEKDKGLTQAAAAVDYTGLIGLVMNVRDKVFTEYKPIVQQPEKPITPTYYVTSTLQTSGSPASELTPGDLTPGVDGETPGVGGPVNGANRPCSSEVGACRIGVQIYQDGAWGDCIGAVFPTDEILDLVDNNCNGQVDEGLTPGVDGETPSVNATSVDATATSTEPMATSTTP